MTRLAIIGGAGRTGTTALFHYLGTHSRVCVSVPKETRFFLEPDFLPMIRRYVFDGSLDNYWKYFAGCDQASVRLEATPEYLYSVPACQNIYKACPDAALIFITREPISRLISWYRYGAQKNVIPPSLDFEGYVRGQRPSKSPQTYPEMIMMELEQSRYMAFIRRYLDAFDPAQILTLPFEHLRDDPKGATARVCRFLGIDGLPDSTEYKAYNSSGVVQNPVLNSLYDRESNRLRLALVGSPMVLKLLKWLRHKVAEPIYIRLNPLVERKLRISASLIDELKAYYREDQELLRATFGPEFAQEFDADRSNVLVE